ncbi:unnamed protein product [Closterium sp. NIES-54]
MLGEGEQRSFMVVYVDDILIFSPSSDLVKEVMLKLQENFKCKALGDMSFYLGLHIERDVEKRCMRVHQRKYLEALAANFGQSEGHVATPFPSGFKCVKGPEEESVGEEERRRFHSLVGSLMYAAVNTRLDVAFATGQLARVVQCPNEEQVAAGIRVAKYLGQTATVGLQFSAAAQRRQKGADGVEPGRLFLTAFSDASYASEPEDMTSVGGFICCVGGGPTAWESKKQVDQALSLGKVAEAVLKEWMPRAQRESGHKVKVIRTNNGGEFIGADFEASLKKKGIQHQLTVPYNPQQNGVAERFNRTLQEGACTLLGRAGLPDLFWVTALRQVALVKNRVLATVGDKQWVPYTKWYGSAPAVNMLRAYGCMVVFHVTVSDEEISGVTEDGGEPEVEEQQQQQQQDVPPRTQRPPDRLRMDVHPPNRLTYPSFGKPMMSGFPHETTLTLRWTGKVGDASAFRVWGSRAFVRDTTADKLSSRAVPCVFLGFPPDAPRWQFYHPTSRRVLSSQDVTFDESVSYYRLFPYRTASPPPPPLFLAPGTPLVDPLPPKGPAPSGVSQVDPAEPVEVAVASGAARGAETGGAVSGDEVPPPGANIVSGMWIFRVKQPPGSPPAFKARYVARGFSQQEGVDFFQTFSPTPKMTTLRVLLHVAARRDHELHSLDFSTAFLQGSLHEEIWLRRPPGFTGSFPTGTQWSLRRPVNGLRQEPCEWHDTLRTTLAALGFAPSTADPSLFLRTDATLPPFYVLLYVDDLVFATANTEALAHVKSELQKRHTCTDLAPPSDEFVEPSGPYPELMGCLMYLMTCTRPDLAYPLSLLARYVAPRRHRNVHWDAAKRVLRYLCSTSGMGLVLGGRARVVLTRHADASFVDDLATQRSLQGYTFSLGSGSVSWRSTHSSSVLSSNCEAEIYAGAMAAQELRWLTYLLTDLGEAPRSPPVLYVDNKAMVALCQEHRLEHRTKHIALRTPSTLLYELQAHNSQLLQTPRAELQ